MAKEQVEIDGVLYGQPVKVKVEVLGKCPKCKGWVFDAKKTMQGEPTKVYTCHNHFHKKCDFYVFKEFSGEPITEEIAIELLEKGSTEKPLNGLVSKKGTKYSSRLMLDPVDFKVKLFREEEKEASESDGSEE